MNNIFELTEENDNISQLMPKREKKDLLTGLNPEQREAVTTTEGPLLVLSGAGTGKTKVLTTRLAHILQEEKAKPQECLVITFTNRAANEMKERVAKVVGDRIASQIWPGTSGTFHSAFLKLLRRHPGLVGLKNNFTILGEDDQKRLIKQILETENIDTEKYFPQAVLDKIQYWKNRGRNPDKTGKNDIYTDIYKKYQERLLELNCVDFADILLHTLNIFLTHTDILKQYQERFKYIMVDEHQDTDITQNLLLHLLSQKHRNLCVVGDDDQSIYAWRGAEVEKILRFEKDFPDAKVIRLERNYRSTANILATASHLISHNTERLGKTLKVADNSPALKGDNDKVKVISVYNSYEEAHYVADEIENFHRRGCNYSDMAVLMRTASQTLEFEKKFNAEAISYKIIGALKFYERAEIRDALSYFRVILQSDDDLAFERIINKPARGVGAKTIQTFRDISTRQHTSLFNATQTALEQNLIKGKAKDGLKKLMDNFTKWHKELDAIKPVELANLVLEDSGYFEMLRNDKAPEAPGRMENLEKLISDISNEEEYPTLFDFLERTSLTTNSDDTSDPNKVTLITLHSAKGLEFDIVFLPGWEEGLFPHQRAMDEGGLEEERRLAYVAITRAKKHLFILTAFSRQLYGQWQNNRPSRFINELPKENIELQNNCSLATTNSYSSGRKDFSKHKAQTYSDRYSYEPDYDGETIIGTVVEHPTFGRGKITKVEGDKLGINFFNYGYKTVMSSYVKIA